MCFLFYYNAISLYSNSRDRVKFTTEIHSNQEQPLVYICMFSECHYKINSIVGTYVF
jgi:hypothetical protein